MKLAGGATAFAFSGLAAGDIESARGENSPFDLEVQKQTLAQVAEEMMVTLDPENIPLPVIVRAESVSDEDFNKMIGFDTEGKRTNFFLPPRTILLTQKSEAHNLAHELVHYLQYNYKGLRDGSTDQVEDQAVSIQNWFKEKNKRKQTPK